MEYLCIDRFEGDCAVCEREDGTMKELPRTALPKGAREGDILAEYPNGRLVHDHAETQRRRQITVALQKKLFE